MNRAEDRLERIAESIADGHSVDWTSETGSDATVEAKARNLQLLERIRDLHRGESGDPRRWGTLDLVDRIGDGSFGEVYRAWDPALQTHVALKLLRKGYTTDDGEHVLREARHLARIRHPNVVTVYGAATHDGRVGIWTELVRGKTLEACLRDQGAYGADEATIIALDLVRAVAALHGAGLVHRDIKASNVMREAGGRIVLTDFGTVVERARLDSLSASEAFAGTALYMAPELFRGERTGRRSDVYSLGVLLYRLVTASYPVDAMNVAELREKHERSEVRPLRLARPELSAEFVRIVERAMAADPAARYASVAEMERDLARLRGVESRVSSPTRSTGRTAFATIAVFAVIVVAWFGAKWIETSRTLAMECSLFRATAGAEERLGPGGRVQPGDQLFLEVRGSRDAWVYVIDEDELGNTYVLYPLSGFDVTNPLRRGTTHRLPGRRDGQLRTWGVDTRGGSETLHIVASRKPLAGLETELRQFPQAGSPIAVTPDVVRRGIGSIGTGSEKTGAETSLSEAIARLADDSATSRGLWTWSIRLENR